MYIWEWNINSLENGGLRPLKWETSGLRWDLALLEWINVCGFITFYMDFKDKWTLCMSLNVANVFSVEFQASKDRLPLISMETLETGPGPICFQLREQWGYFIIVIMIYSPSTWVRSFWHMRNTHVGGSIRQIMPINAHAYMLACGRSATFSGCTSVSLLQCWRDKSFPLRWAITRVIPFSDH